MTSLSRRQFLVGSGAIAAVGALGLAGCSSGSSSDESSSGESSSADNSKQKITIATSSVSVDLANSGIQALEDMGYETEVVVFDDYYLPNEAIVEGSADCNLYQHEPFLDMYNEEKGTDIIMLDPKLWNFWAGIYSVKADSIEDLPDGGKVGVAEDASNLDQDLRRLESVGLIKLTDEDKDLYDIADITENPHNYEFVQADHTKYSNMDDYTFLIGTSNTMASAGVDPTEHLLKKFVDDSLTQGMCIIPENQDEQWVADLMDAYTSDSARDAVPESTGFEAAF